jgi:hypothetical protein
MSSNNNNKNHQRNGGNVRGGRVRFAPETNDTTPLQHQRRPKRQRSDDMDEDAAGLLPTEHNLMEAKRLRRMQREQGLAASVGSTTRWDEEEDNDHISKYEDSDEEEVEQLELDYNDDDDNDNDEHTRERDARMDRSRSLAAEGIAIEPFHMNQEQSDGTGYFDGDTYVFRKRNVDEEPDAWLESLAEQQQQQGDNNGQDGLASTKAIPLSKEKDERNTMDIWTDHALFSKIVTLISDTETVM